VTEPSGGSASLSDALKNFFLPFRKEVLIKAICKPNEGVAMAEALPEAPTQDVQGLISAIQTESDAGKQAELERNFLTKMAAAKNADIKKPGFFVENRRPH
jgi:hypothetical protein